MEPMYRLLEELRGLNAVPLSLNFLHEQLKNHYGLTIPITAQ